MTNPTNEKINALIEKYKEECKSQGHLISHGYEVPQYRFIEDLQSLLTPSEPTKKSKLIDKIMGELTDNSYMDKPGGILEISLRQVRLHLQKHLPDSDIGEVECKHIYRAHVIDKCNICGKYGKERN